MKQFKLDRYYYHKTDVIEEWLRKNIGNGTWYAGDIEHLSEEFKWTISQMFGYSTYTFRDDRDALMFAMIWL